MSLIERLINYEDTNSFKDINKEFQVIDSDTVTTIVDSDLASVIANGGGDWQQLQRNAVAIRRSNIKKWNLKEIAPGVYQWTLNYNGFIGYMQGVLEIESISRDFLI